jgi:hypothetical protein
MSTRCPICPVHARAAQSDIEAAQRTYPPVLPVPKGNQRAPCFGRLLCSPLLIPGTGQTNHRIKVPSLPSSRWPQNTQHTTDPLPLEQPPSSPSGGSERHPRVCLCAMGGCMSTSLSSYAITRLQFSADARQPLRNSYTERRGERQCSQTVAPQRSCLSALNLSQSPKLSPKWRRYLL